MIWFNIPSSRINHILFYLVKEEIVNKTPLSYTPRVTLFPCREMKLPCTNVTNDTTQNDVIPLGVFCVDSVNVKYVYTSV